MGRSNEIARRGGIVLATAVVVAAWGAARGQTAYSTLSSGNWNDSSIWSPTGVPTGSLGDSVSVSGSTTVFIADAESALRASFGTGASSPGNFSITSTGSLLIGGIASTSGRMFISTNSTAPSVGTIDAGGVLRFDSNASGGGLTLALNDGSNGSLIVNGTLDYSQVIGGSSNGPYIGYKGAGTLTVNPGASVDFRTTTTSSQVEMGFNQGAVSTLNINGGTFTGNFINIRNVANAANPVDAIVNVNISGGTANFLVTSASGLFQSNVATGKVSAATLNLSGGTLGLKAPLHASAQTLAGFNWSGGAIQMSQASGTVTFTDNVNLAGGGSGAIFDSNGTTNTMSGALSGTGSLTKVGAGLLTLSGAESFGGGINVNAGTLTISGTANTVTGGITVAPGAALLVASGSTGPATNVITLQGGTLAASGTTATSSVTLANTIAVTGDVTIGTNAASTARVVLGGVTDLGGATRRFTINAAGNGTAPSPARALDLGGTFTAGSLILTGVSGNGTEHVRAVTGLVFPGTLTLDGVTLNQAANAALPATTNLVIGAGGILDMGDGASFRNPTVASLAGSGRVTNSSTGSGQSTLTVSGTSTTTFSGVIADGAGVTSAFTFSGGQLTLSGPNTYTGPTTVSGGKLILASGSTVNSTTVNVNGGTFDPSAAYPGGFPVAAGATFTYNGAVVGNLLNNGLVKNNLASGTTTIGNTITGSGSFNKTSAVGTVVFTGAASFPTLFKVDGGLTVLGATSVVSSNVYQVSSAATLDVTAIPALQVGSTGTLAMNGLILGNIVNNGAMTVGAANDLSYPANISGTGTITKNNLSTGTSTLTGSVTTTGNITAAGGMLIAQTPLRPVTGSLVVTGPGAFSLDVPGGGASHVVAGQFNGVSLSASGNATVATTDRSANVAEVVVLNSISAAGGTLNLGNNDAVIHSMAEADVRALVGTGLTASTSNALAGLGVIANSDGMGGTLNPSFDGVSVGSSDVLVKYTYLGDTDLNGVVDGNDLANYLAGRSGGLSGWVNGDFNYDGHIDDVDLGLLLASLQGQTISFGGPGGTGGAVPEPGVGLIAVGLAGAGLRRRRPR